MLGLAAGAATVAWLALRSADEQSPTVPALPSLESPLGARRGSSPSIADLGLNAVEASPARPEIDYGDRGLVAGRILGPPVPGEVRLTWTSDREVVVSRVDLDEDGDTELNIALEPGTWSVQLDCRYCYGEQRLARDLRVEARRVSRPPELNPLDVGPFVDVAEVQVVDLSGAPYTRADLAVGGHVRDTNEEGLARLLLCKAKHSLTVRSFGYRTVRGALRPGFQEIVMRRGPRVRFRMEPESLHTQSEATVGMTLFHGDKAIGGVLVLDDTWSRETPLSEPGTYRVGWSLLLPDSPRPTFLADSPLASSSIYVLDVDEVQDFVLHFPEERLQGALAEIDEDH